LVDLFDPGNDLINTTVPVLEMEKLKHRKGV
jgi:hypothetical protein